VPSDKRGNAEFVDISLKTINADFATRSFACACLGEGYFYVWSGEVTGWLIERRQQTMAVTDLSGRYFVVSSRVPARRAFQLGTVDRTHTGWESTDRNGCRKKSRHTHITVFGAGITVSRRGPAQRWRPERRGRIRPKLAATRE
jgi:hypothetical protein